MSNVTELRLSLGNITATRVRLPAMSEGAIANVSRLEQDVLAVPQTPLPTYHLLHAGMYARTICIPAGSILTGALIKIATTLIVSGRVTVYTGEGMGGETIELEGYNVLPGSAGRKQAFIALSNVHLTMIFPSDADTILAAEEQFTDDAARPGQWW